MSPHSSRRTTEHIRKKRNKCSNLKNRNRRDARGSREYQEDNAARKYQSGREPTRQAEGGGVISPTYLDITDFSNNKVYIDMSVDFYRR